MGLGRVDIIDFSTSQVISEVKGRPREARYVFRRMQRNGKVEEAGGLTLLHFRNGT